MRVAIYVRVSTVEQAKEGYSVQEQIKRLTKFCEAHGWIVYKIYIDAGCSGSNTERHELQEMLKAVEAGAVDAVLVYKLDRLSRSQRDTLNLIDRFLKNNVEFISMSESFDTSTPYGRAMIGILATFAQLERDMFRERVEVGKQGRAEEGKFHGGKYAPVGYTYVNGQLVVNEFEAMQIKEAFRMFTSRASVNSICDRLNNAGMTHRNKWSNPAMKYVLQNRSYLGYTKHKDGYYKGQHEPIIDEETFNKAQELFKEREGKAAKAFSHTCYLGGLIWCGKCGARYYKRYVRKNKEGVHNHTYSCYSRTKQNKSQVRDENCKNDHILMDEFDEKIFEMVKSLRTDPNAIVNIQESSRDADTALQIEVMRIKIEEIDEQMSRYADLYAIGNMDMASLKKKVEVLAEDKKGLEGEIAQLSNISSLTNENVIDLSMAFSEALDNGSFDDVKFILSELIEKIVIEDSENIRIHWSFS